MHSCTMCFWFILYNIEHLAVKSNSLDFHERCESVTHCTFLHDWCNIQVLNQIKRKKKSWGNCTKNHHQTERCVNPKKKLSLHDVKYRRPANVCRRVRPVKYYLDTIRHITTTMLSRTLHSWRTIYYACIYG